MKKFFTLCAAACMASSMMATDYNGQLAVILNGQMADTHKTTISINKQDDGNYTLSLKNFSMVSDADTMYVGNVELTGVKAEKNDEGFYEMETTQGIAITAGDDDSKDWMGPILTMGNGGKIDVTVMASFNDDRLTTTIEIPFGPLDIKVAFDNGNYHLLNGGFEDYHTATLYSPEDPSVFVTSDEPNNWHSFMSASGPDTWRWMAGYNTVTFIDDEVRPGSTGKHSLKLKAIDMWIAIANGTITTGRMNTGSISAADTNSNYAWLDSSDAKDDHGDPFYTKMDGMPDSLKVWVKFGQGKADGDKAKDHPYATITAIITDGTSFQEPAPSDVTYNNVVAEARYPKIASTNGKWQEITIPFELKNAELDPKQILVTCSTNADAGMGSGGDSLYIDDMQLIYNSELSDIKVKDKSIAGFKSDVHEYTIAFDGMPTEDDIDTEATNGSSAIIYINEEDKEINVLSLAQDLQSSTLYTLKVVAAGIDSVNGDKVGNNACTGYYDLRGIKVDQPETGKVYIAKYADGSVKKIVK